MIVEISNDGKEYKFNCSKIFYDTDEHDGTKLYLFMYLKDKVDGYTMKSFRMDEITWMRVKDE